MTRFLLTLTALTAAANFACLASYASLPPQIPIHFNAMGIADGFAPKLEALLLLASTVPGVPLLMLIAIPIERRWGRGAEHMERNLPTLLSTALATSALMLVLLLMILRSALSGSGRLSMGNLLIALSGLHVALGFVMGKLRSNHVIGIRTPWTLGSEAVWHRTHRVAGWAFTLGGLAGALLATMLPSSAATPSAVAALFTSAMYPALYSFVIRDDDRGHA
ncbi:MAG: SdpI family protein [Myxococcales bacterium]|nr:SdpI family protein [Myxococcales bacterium]